MSGNKPLCIMIAGPNGSGKSSTTQDYRLDNPDFPSIYINADDLKIKHQLTDKQAQQKADEMRRSALDRGESFAFETVMSHISKIDVLREAKEKGYETRTLYITTQDPVINMLRVRQRVAHGGHSVPDDKIGPRYDRSMALLPLALIYSDKAKVFNNSFENPILIYEKDRKLEKHYPQLPPSKWNKEAILKTTQASKEAISEYQHIERRGRER